MDATWLDTWRLSPRARRTPPPAVGSRPGIQLIDLPAATLRVRVAGGGARTIVYVPDPPNVIEHCDRLVDRLAPVARIVCVESAGFGFSFPRPGFRFTLEEQAATLCALLEQMASGPYVLAFPCVASYAALKIAAERPELVERLVLIQAPGWGEELKWARRVDRRGVIRAPVVGQALTALAARSVARQWYRAALPRAAPPEMLEAFLAPALRALDQKACFCLASAFQATFGGDVPSFGPVTQATAVVWGGADRSHRRTRKESIREHVPHAEWHEFPAAGHFPELEEPERFAALVERFALG